MYVVVLKPDATVPNSIFGLGLCCICRLTLYPKQISYALVALHEFIHLAGGADQYGAPIYNDYLLADAARILTGAPGYPSGPKPRTREEQDKLRADTGNYWDRQLRAHCSPTGG
jgi:hypothetical protein